VSSRPYSSAEEGVRVLGECASLRSEAAAEGASAPPLAVVLLHHDDLIPRLRENGTLFECFPMSAQLAVNSFLALWCGKCVPIKSLALWCGRCVPIQFQSIKKLTVPPIAVSKEGA
jgi:hypothetical protein